MASIILTVTNDLVFDQRMIRICRSLVNAGYDIELVGREKQQSLPLASYGFQQTRLRCFFERGKLFYLEYNLRLLIYLYFRSFDIICSIDLDTLLPGYLVSRWRSRVLVYDAHEYFTEVPEVVNRPAIKWIWSVLAAWIIPRVKYAYTVGDCLAKEFQNRYGTSFSVIRNLPMQRTEVAHPLPDQVPILLYQGYLNEGRGLELAIGAMRQLPEAQLWLAGEGDLSEPLRRLVKEYGVENQVTFLGKVAPEEMRKITLQATIGINLLENRGLNYYFSLANKAMEYVQAGLPSIQMDFPEYRHLQEQFGCFHLLPEFTENAYVGAVRRLLSDRAYYQHIQEHCLQYRSQLTWEEEEQKLLFFYRQIIV